MKKIAFLTSKNYQPTLDKCSDFVNEFELLKGSFQALGAELILANWRDSNVDWNAFDALIPKACWDYSENAVEFVQFIQKMMNLGIPLQNSAKTVLWNMRKTYLTDLKNKGLRVGDFRIIPQGTAVTTDVIFETLAAANFHHGDNPMIVAKPSIGGGASDTIRFNLNDLEECLPHFKLVLNYSDLILQPFFPEIKDGEYSFFYFDQKYSHAILKKPAKEDYRAHQLFGAKNNLYTPSTQEIEEAFQFVKAGDPECAYARVDAFLKNGQFHLIELELIEPYLYLEKAPPESLRQFAVGILKRI